MREGGLRTFKALPLGKMRSLALHYDAYVIWEVCRIKSSDPPTGRNIFMIAARIVDIYIYIYIISNGW